MRFFTFWISLATVFFCLSKANAQTPGNKYQSYSFQYSTSVIGASGTSNVVNAFSAEGLPKFYTLSISGTATPVNVVLEGSLDNSNWATIAVTNSYTGAISNALPLPFIYFRTRVSSITANGFVTATAVGTW